MFNMDVTIQNTELNQKHLLTLKSPNRAVSALQVQIQLEGVSSKL